MPSAFDKLNKILRLEQSQGYRDKAVIGGIDNFAGIWRGEALAEPEADPAQLDEIAALLAGYSGRDERGRAELITDVLARLKPSGAPPAHTEPSPSKPVPVPAAAAARHEPGPAGSILQPLPKTNAGLEAPVETLPGISAGFGAKLRKLGIATVGDLLYHFPHRYDDYRTLKPINLLEYGEETTIIGTIWDTKTRSSRGGSAIVSSIIADASGTIEAVWFNQPYLARQLRAGMQIVLSGKVEEHLGRLIMRAPTWEPLEKELIHTARLVPIYPLTQGISARWARPAMSTAVAE